MRDLRQLQLLGKVSVIGSNGDRCILSGGDKVEVTSSERLIWQGVKVPRAACRLKHTNSTHRFPNRLVSTAPIRRAFEKHFKEWRHQNGMRALSIPNNKNFYEVTKIADAESLWSNIQVRVGPRRDPRIDLAIMKDCVRLWAGLTGYWGVHDTILKGASHVS